METSPPAAVGYVERRPGGPGDHAHSHRRFFDSPVEPAIVDHFAVFAGIGVIDFSGLDVIRGIDPIERPRGSYVFFVRIIFDLVVRGPTSWRYSNRPVAKARRRPRPPLGCLRVRLPFRLGPSACLPPARNIPSSR